VRWGNYHTRKGSHPEAVLHLRLTNPGQPEPGATVYVRLVKAQCTRQPMVSTSPPVGHYFVCVYPRGVCFPSCLPEDNETGRRTATWMRTFLATADRRHDRQSAKCCGKSG